jgi:hypothetical protein
MIYSDKVKDFIGKKGQCEPNVSGFSFYLSNSSKVDTTKDTDTITEVGEDFAVISCNNPYHGTERVIVPLSRLVIYC